MRDAFAPIDLKKVAICSAIFALVATIVHATGAFLMQKLYAGTESYSHLFNPLISSAGDGQLGLQFLAILFAIFLAIGAINAIFYISIKSSIKGTTPREKGMRFAIILFALQGIMAAILALLFFRLPAFLVLEWMLEMIITYATIGVVFAMILEGQ